MELSYLRIISYLSCWKIKQFIVLCDLAVRICLKLSVSLPRKLLELSSAWFHYYLFYQFYQLIVCGMFIEEIFSRVLIYTSHVCEGLVFESESESFSFRTRGATAGRLEAVL